MDIDLYNKNLIIDKIKRTTNCLEFKKKIQFFRKNKNTKKQDIHEYFLENNDDFYYYHKARNKNVDITFLEFYSNNMRWFYTNFEDWVKHIEDTYIQENRFCVIS